MSAVLVTIAWWAGVIAAGMIANRKLRRWWPYSLIAAFAPLIGVIVALAVPDRSGQGRWLGGER